MRKRVFVIMVLIAIVGPAVGAVCTLGALGLGVGGWPVVSQEPQRAQPVIVTGDDAPEGLEPVIGMDGGGNPIYDEHPEWGPVIGGDSEGNPVYANEPEPEPPTPGPSMGDDYILFGDGCPDKYTYVRDGASYDGCTFTTYPRPRNATHPMSLHAECPGMPVVSLNPYESRPVFRDTVEPGLMVFWPGNRFACVKER